MPSTNGKRPVVELVMLTNGKYQPIKFTNNRQVTESIPKRLFDQANLMKKTLYQRSVQVCVVCDICSNTVCPHRYPRLVLSKYSWL